MNEKPQWIGGAQEPGAFLLADGYLEGSCSDVVRGFWVQGRGQVSDFDPTNAAFAELLLASHSFGEIADIGIGDVTGCNRVFLLSDAERERDHIPASQISSIVSRARHITGLVVTKRELARLANRLCNHVVVRPIVGDLQSGDARQRQLSCHEHFTSIAHLLACEFPGRGCAVGRYQRNRYLHEASPDESQLSWGIGVQIRLDVY